MRLPTALASLLLLALGCRPSADSATPEPAPAPAAAATAAPTEPLGEVALEVDEARLRAHVEFLADDAQKGRPPGTEADARVQRYIIEQFKAAGLGPGFADGYQQPFEVTDGVRPTGESRFASGKQAVAHGLVPFTSSTSGPISGRLVFVGHGIAPKGKGTGDYAGQESRVAGAIVVALAGAPADDPHMSPSLTRPQSKLIAARDHGAAGFVLWEPEMETPFPNHGEANDLKLPAVWVGKEGTPALLKALKIKVRGKAGVKQTLAGAKPGRASNKSFELHTPVEPITLRTANVAGVLPASSPGARVLMLGAHMDHLGEGTSSSLAPGVKAVHNGADDNASGVGALIEAARVLGSIPADKRPYTLHFIAFGAEEMGLLGSKHYVANLPGQVRKYMIAMLNFDMVGRLSPDGLVISGVGTSSVWPDLLERSRGSLTIKTSDDGYGASDQTSFYEAGVPVLHFFTGSHEDYHKPSDDVDKINFPGAVEVAELAVRVVHTMQREGIQPDFIKVARKAPGGRVSFRVSLGTIPDYGAKVDGVRLTGVREGGAAAKAGMRSGDVIQKIGDREIHNLDDYMATFAVLEPGKAVDVIVLRDGATVTLSMSPDAPRRRR